MAKTIQQLKAQGAEVKNATVVGENTATRVGTLFNDIVEHVEDYEAKQADRDTQQDNTAASLVNTEKERAMAAEAAEAEARDIAINNEAQTRAKNDENLNKAIVAETARAKAAEEANTQAIAKRGIYDVSAYNGGAVFESLSALLNNDNLSTLIPTSVRHGGMSIRFIHSSDNKYVQYRLMSQTFSTDEANWQGVDDESMLGSDNLVKSGGVANEFASVNTKIDGNNKEISKEVTLRSWNELGYPIKAGVSYHIRIVSCTASLYSISFTSNGADGNMFDLYKLSNIEKTEDDITFNADGVLSVYDASPTHPSSPSTYVISVRANENLSAEIEKLKEIENNKTLQIFKVSDFAFNTGITFDYLLKAGRKYKVEIDCNEQFIISAMVEGYTSETIQDATNFAKKLIIKPIANGNLRIYNQSTDQQSKSIIVRCTEVINENLTPIRIIKLDNNNFKIMVLNSATNKYLVHTFSHNSYTKDMSAYGGAADMLCGNMIEAMGVYDEAGNIIVPACSNFVYLVDSTQPGYEYENLHVGFGGGFSGAHGLEVMQWCKLFADGVPFTIADMPSEIQCSTFRLIEKSNCLAPDSRISAINANNPPKLVDGQPIVTAEHFVDMTYSIDNLIRWRNRLTIKRDRLKFAQAHGAMLAAIIAKFPNMIIYDNKTTSLTYTYEGGAFTETVNGDGNAFNHQTLHGDEAVIFGNGYIIRQRLIQDDGRRYNKSFLMGNNNGSTVEMKCYFMPVETGDAGEGEEFNSGDIISVTCERKIEVLQ